jgi:hypothetical protein
LEFRIMRSAARRFYFLWLLPLCVSSQSGEDKWSGCILEEGKSSEIKIGDPTRVCLQVGNSLDWGGGVQYVRASFEPEADEYSRLRIRGCKF